MKRSILLSLLITLLLTSSAYALDSKDEDGFFTRAWTSMKADAKFLLFGASEETIEIDYEMVELEKTVTMDEIVSKYNAGNIKNTETRYYLYAQFKKQNGDSLKRLLKGERVLVPVITAYK